MERFEEIQELLEKTLSLGMAQFEHLKNKVGQPIKTETLMYSRLGSIILHNDQVVAETLANPEIFLLSKAEAFWNVYKSTLEILDKPASLFLMRPLMECCYGQLVYLASKDQSERKQLSIQAWLCITGLVIQTESSQEQHQDWNGVYAELLKRLPKDSHESKVYSDVALQGFPFDRLNSIQHKLFPSLSKPDLGTLSKLKDIWEADLINEQMIGSIFRWSSLYIHGNHVAVRHLNDPEGHLIRVPYNLGCTGLTTIRLLETEFGDAISGLDELKAILSTLRGILKVNYDKKRAS